MSLARTIDLDRADRRDLFAALLLLPLAGLMLVATVEQRLAPGWAVLAVAGAALALGEGIMACRRHRRLRREPGAASTAAHATRLVIAADGTAMLHHHGEPFDRVRLRASGRLAGLCWLTLEIGPGPGAAMPGSASGVAPSGAAGFRAQSIQRVARRLRAPRPRRLVRVLTRASTGVDWTALQRWRLWSARTRRMACIVRDRRDRP